jgi:hypothetical protein
VEWRGLGEPELFGNLQNMNTSHFSRAGFVILSAGLACCSTNPRRESAACPFEYTARVRSEVILPELQLKEGKFASNFELDNPGIVTKRNRVELIFRFNKNAMDPPNFVVVLDPCTLRIVQAGETTPLTITK